MAIIGIVSVISLLIIEYRLFEGAIYYIESIFKRKLPPVAVEDVINRDVEEEKKRVEQMTMADLQTNNLVLQRLSKFYGSFLAVNQISIGIKEYVAIDSRGINQK